MPSASPATPAATAFSAVVVAAAAAAGAGTPGLVQNAIETALHANPAIRNAVMKVRVRIWADQSGRIERVQLASSTGDKDVDAALQDALSGVALGQAPPTDMPMPIVAEITGRRPN